MRQRKIEMVYAARSFCFGRLLTEHELDVLDFASADPVSIQEPPQPEEEESLDR